MQINKAEFIKSSKDNAQLPPADYPEYAFIGRSNVGKSSLINMLTDRKGLAKTSATPGKTQLINHFLINGQWYLVDLPGYGYAKVNKTERAGFMPMIENFLAERETLMNVFLLVDSRHEPQSSDLDFCRLLAINELPFSFVFTKTDKLTKNQLNANLALYKKVLLKEWEELPPIFLTSAETRAGREELLGYIHQINQDVS